MSLFSNEKLKIYYRFLQQIHFTGKNNNHASYTDLSRLLDTEKITEPLIMQVKRER